MMRRECVRIGCGAGFWGDSAEGPPQLADSGQVDYIVLDYLAEITMSLLARARAKDPAQGYAGDLPGVIARIAPQIKARQIKLVTNGGGVNPGACKAAIDSRLRALGIDLKISVVGGDDLLPQAEVLKASGIREMFSGEAFPDQPWSVNAYLGAFPIARALDDGADIVLTGRCVDSALALGPLIHEFGWTPHDYDRLSAGSLLGHIIECGVQATGGVSTDWRDVAEDWDRMGFPIAECRPDGVFVVTKPTGTGGRVVPDTIAEQVVYEIGNPRAYLLPDVSCDFSTVRLQAVGHDRVEVSGARGNPPGDHYKVSATYQDGFRCTATMMIGGVEAVAKAEAVAAAILKRCRRLMTQAGFGDFRRSDIELLGAEANWGAYTRARGTREVVLKIAVHHDQAKALDVFSREFVPPATSMAQGITGFFGGRPSAVPLVRLFSCLVPKQNVAIEVDGAPFVIPVSSTPSAASRALSHGAFYSAAIPKPAADTATAKTDVVPLIDLAFGRSGDKGNSANIGILARRPEYLDWLREQLTAEAVGAYLSHLVAGPVERFEWPGLGGFNFLLSEALGGGGTASLRYDPQGKLLAQVLMDFPVRVPSGKQAGGST